MRLKNIKIFNRAPIDRMDLDFNDEMIDLLSGLNGSGKTTIISYIVDSFYELAKLAYFQEFEDIQGKFYRLSSGFNAIEMDQVSFIYIHYVDGEDILEYLDIQGKCDKDQLKEILDKNTKLNVDRITKDLEQLSVKKIWSVTENKRVKDIFENNLITFFPAYRYEKPAYLTEPYEIKLSFNDKTRINGYLINPIEVMSDLNGITNWIMDVVLDSHFINEGENGPLHYVNEIISALLYPKVNRKVNIAIGPRTYGAARIQIVDSKSKKTIYPSVFGMSSGELAVLCLFAELAKQADMLGRNAKFIEGIVVIDEIDKHLHMFLQKEVIPKLMILFPKLQFIISSHSPFVNVGIFEHFGKSCKIFDMDRQGEVCTSDDSNVYKEMYEDLIDRNKHYYEMYKCLDNEIRNLSKPLIITEGKTDWKHIKTAMRRLGVEKLNAVFYESEEVLGDSELIKTLKRYSSFNLSNKIIGIFDRDNEEILSQLENEDGAPYEFLQNKVYGIVLPLKNNNYYGDKISIEHYYKPEHLKKEDKNGRRIFLGEEFYASGNSVNGKYQTKCKGIDNKVKINGVVDSKVYSCEDLEQKDSIALSKNEFADLVYTDDEFARDFDFTSFKPLIDTLFQICGISKTIE